MTDLAALAAPFPPDRISWRVGSTTQDKSKGMALAFIDARDVMQRLDEVCGLAGWQCRYPHAGEKTVCEIGVKVGEEWIWRADGAGDSDVEKEKGALSDAFKRAAVRFGIGRYLYDVASPWVALEAAGRSFKIADREIPKLHALLSKNRPGPDTREKQIAPVGAPQSEPPQGQAAPPSPSASPAVWQEYGKTLLAAAQLAERTEDLAQWQREHAAGFAAIQEKSAKLHDWLAAGMSAHYSALSMKETL